MLSKGRFQEGAFCPRSTENRRRIKNQIPDSKLGYGRPQMDEEMKAVIECKQPNGGKMPLKKEDRIREYIADGA